MDAGAVGKVLLVHFITPDAPLSAKEIILELAPFTVLLLVYIDPFVPMAKTGSKADGARVFSVHFNVAVAPLSVTAYIKVLLLTMYIVPSAPIVGTPELVPIVRVHIRIPFAFKAYN
jgi:hypothetical protein